MPETVGTIHLEIVGNMLPIARAFGIMSAALAAYGHEFTDEQMTVIATAAEQITVRTGEMIATGETIALDFDVAATLEQPG
jgi:hypothetical protein